MSTLVIVGAGPGLGLSLAEKFGKKNFNVALISRNQDNVDALQNSLAELNINSSGFTADVTDKQQLDNAFSRIRERFGQIDVLIYNAAVIAPIRATDTTADIANQHLQVNIIGGIASAQQVIPEMVERKDGAIFFTSGGASELTATPILTTLSIGKSGLRAYAHCLHEELSTHGVHVGMLSIAGVIEDGTYFSPENIADEYFDMYEKREGAERFYIDASQDSASVLKETYSG